jgi:protein-S-isoprenylcysteine O-methyltransferase Ste14
VVEPADDNPGVIAPPPLIAAATLIIGLILDQIAPAFILTVLVSFRVRPVIGILLIGAGAALAIVAERTFRRIGTNVPPWKPTLNLAVGGVYAHVRNPMYVGMGLIIAGLAIVFASDWTLFLLVPAALMLHFGVVLREEKYLEAKFGDTYRRYRERVPRYGWPS